MVFILTTTTSFFIYEGIANYVPFHSKYSSGYLDMNSDTTNNPVDPNFCRAHLYVNHVDTTRSNLSATFQIEIDNGYTFSFYYLINNVPEPISYTTKTSGAAIKITFQIDQSKGLVYFNATTKGPSKGPFRLIRIDVYNDPSAVITNNGMCNKNCAFPLNPKNGFYEDKPNFATIGNENNEQRTAAFTPIDASPEDQDGYVTLLFLRTGAVPGNFNNGYQATLHIGKIPTSKYIAKFDIETTEDIDNQTFSFYQKLPPNKLTWKQIYSWNGKAKGRVLLPVEFMTDVNGEATIKMTATKANYDSYVFFLRRISVAISNN
jgi:hypothetical protein